MFQHTGTNDVTEAKRKPITKAGQDENTAHGTVYISTTIIYYPHNLQIGPILIPLMSIHPTGQKYSLELMSAKFATAEIAKDLDPLGACCLKTTKVF